MKITRAWSLLLIFLLTCLCSLAQDAELINYKVELEVSGNKLTEVSNYRIQINNPDGEAFSTVQIPYSSISKISKIEAELFTGSGLPVRKLNKSEIVNRSAISDISLYDDNMVAEFTLRHSRYPYILEYRFERRSSQFIHLAHWMPVLGWNVPTRNAELVLIVPAEYKVNYKEYGIDDPKISSDDKTTRYQWQTSCSEVKRMQVWSPALSELMPRVVVVPEKFSFEKDGSLESWTSYGDWEYSLLEGLNDLPEDEKQRLAAQLNGITDTREQIKALYHFLQDQTRYINVSIETGGMVPYSASYVAANKYGDCKALTNYFKSVLDWAGIPCYYANISAGEQIEPVDQELVAQQFNHVFLIVPIESDTLWLDCTSKGPFSYVGSFIQNREALLIDQGRSHFVRTPALSAEQSKTTRCIRVELPQDGQSQVSVEGSYRGEMFEQFSALETQLSASDRERILRNYVLPGGFELIDYQLKREHRDSLQIQVDYQGKTTKLYRDFGNETVVFSIAISLPRFEKPDKRRYPVQLDRPMYICDQIDYVLPEGNPVPVRNPEVSMSGRFGSYERSFQVKDGLLRVNRKLLLNAGYYTLDDYPEFYDFIDKVQREDSNALLSLTKPQ